MRADVDSKHEEREEELLEVEAFRSFLSPVHKLEQFGSWYLIGGDSCVKENTGYDFEREKLVEVEFITG